MRKGHREIIEVLKTSQSKVRCTLDHLAICNITYVIYTVDLCICLHTSIPCCHVMDLSEKYKLHVFS